MISRLWTLKETITRFCLGQPWMEDMPNTISMDKKLLKWKQGTHMLNISILNPIDIWVENYKPTYTNFENNQANVLKLNIDVAYKLHSPLLIEEILEEFNPYSLSKLTSLGCQGTTPFKFNPQSPKQFFQLCTDFAYKDDEQIANEY
jgi:hypothetical protein